MPVDKEAKKGAVILEEIIDPDYHKELKRSMSGTQEIHWSVTLWPPGNSKQTIVATML